MKKYVGVSWVVATVCTGLCDERRR